VPEKQTSSSANWITHGDKIQETSKMAEMTKEEEAD